MPILNHGDVYNKLRRNTMPSWLIKAGIQGTISLLPRSQDINYLFQRYVSKGLVLKDKYFETKLKVAKQHIEHFQEYSQSEKKLPANAIELGTGWLPIVPIALALCGIRQIYSVDISPLTRPNLVRDTLQYFITYIEEGRIHEHLPIKNMDVDLLKQAQAILDATSIEDALKHLNIITIVTDARYTDFEADSIEYFVSNSTMEHIPPEILNGILQEFYRIGTNKALHSHLIDMSDHYSHFDKSITPYNFLKFEDNVWRLFNNSLQYQNRLRITDYRQIHTETGFEILLEKNSNSRQEQLNQIQLADRFKSYAHEDLIVTSSFIISRPEHI